MTGAHAKWTPSRRAAMAKRMRKQNADPAFRERRAEACAESPYRLARLRALVIAINQQRADDPEVRQRWIEAIRESAYQPKRMKQLIGQMTEVSRRPERRRASREFIAALNTRPEVRRKQTATRRGIDIPEEMEQDFQKIRRKVGLAEAVRIMKQECPV